MLTQNDYDEVEELIRKVVKEETSHLPSKDYFYDENAKLMKKLDKIDANTTVLSGQMPDRTDRIEKLEKIHPKYTHASV